MSGTPRGGYAPPCFPPLPGAGPLRAPSPYLRWGDPQPSGTMARRGGRRSEGTPGPCPATAGISAAGCRDQVEEDA